MPGDAFKKAIPGQRLDIPAAAWNAVIDATRYVQDLRASLGDPATAARRSNVVLVQNSSGEEVGRWGILALGDPIILPADNETEFQSRIAFEGTTPDGDTEAGHFVVLVDPLAPGEIGRGILAGVTQCRLSVSGDVEAFAEAESGNFASLASTATGTARVLWVEDSEEEERWAIVRLGDPGTTEVDVDAINVVASPALTPSYSASTLFVLTTDGLTLDQPSAGTARIGATDATPTQRGIVSLDPQEWAGEKSFKDGIQIDGDALFYNSGVGLRGGGLLGSVAGHVYLQSNYDSGYISQFDLAHTSTFAGFVVSETATNAGAFSLYTDPTDATSVMKVWLAGKQGVSGGVYEFNSQTGDLTLVTPSGFAPVYKIKIDTTTYAGGTTTTGGLTFRGGLYISGSATAAYTDEQAQDAVGTILTDTATIDLTYDDGTPQITADVKANSIGVALMHASATDVLFGRSTAGAGAGEEIACTAAGRALLDDATAANQRTTLGATTVGSSLFTLTDPSAVTFIRVNADNTVTARSAANFRTDLSLVPGTDVQAFDAELAAIAGLVSAADRLPYFTGSGTASLATFTAAGRALVDDATAGDQRTTLGGTTVGQSYFTLTNPSAITFPRMNADNTVSALDAATFRTAIGAGTGTGDVVGPGSATDEALARFDSTTGKLIQNSSATLTDAGDLTLTLTDAETTNSSLIQTLRHNSSGTPSDAFGSYIQWQLESSTTDNRDAARLQVDWAASTDASRKARVRFYAYDTGLREYLRGEASGSAPKIGFLGANASAALASPDLGTLATTFGLATGTPTFAAANITGDLAFSNLTQIAGLSVLGVTGSSTADVAAITSTSDLQIFYRASATSLTFGFPDGRSLTHIGARGYRNGAATNFFTSGSYRTIEIDAEDWDTNSILDSSTNKGRFTVPTGMGGKWLLIAQVGIGSMAAGNLIDARWLLNGTTTIAEASLYAGGTGTNYVWAITVAALAAADYVEAQGFQNSGASKNLGLGTAVSFASATLLEVN